MMMDEPATDKKPRELTVLQIPDHDGNWKNSVSIGGVVCMILCAIQVFAFLKPAGPKPRAHDEGVEMKEA